MYKRLVINLMVFKHFFGSPHVKRDLSLRHSMDASIVFFPIKNSYILIIAPLSPNVCPRFETHITDYTLLGFRAFTFSLVVKIVNGRTFVRRKIREQ